MTSPQAPGWYQDPMGRPGDARWWDGTGWTESHFSRDSMGDDPQFAHLQSLDVSSGTGAHTVASPGAMQEYEVYVPATGGQWQDSTSAYGYGYGYADGGQPDAGQPNAGPATDGSDGLFSRPGFEAPSARQRTALWWGFGGIAAIAVVLVLLVATGVFSADGPEDPGANPGTYTEPSSGQSQDQVRVIDKASGISYKYLGDGWQAYNMGILSENQDVVGEYIVTQEAVPGGGNFIAQVTSGLLAEAFGSPGPGDFPATLKELETSVRGNYYPQPNEATNVAEATTEIDGAPAATLSFDLVWDVEGYDSTGERVMLMLIDTGKSSPVFFYCSFPNTHAELYPLIDEVIASITVD